MRSQRYESRLMTAAGVLTFFAFAMPAFAVDIVDDPVQIDERATQLIQASNTLCWEMYRYHQQKPDYAQDYRWAKEIWGRAGQLREALRAAPLETEVLNRQVNEMSDIFAKLEKALLAWGPGDLALVPSAGGAPQRTVVSPGTVVSLPFIGVQVGPRVYVTDDGAPPLERRRLHPNSHGSKRSLVRELMAVRIALDYLREDAGLASTSTGAQGAAGPVPESVAREPELGEQQKIPATKKPNPPAGPNLP